MRRNYTLRKNNKLMTTVNIPFHFSKEEIEWVMKKLHCSEAQAISKMSKQLNVRTGGGDWVIYENSLYLYDHDNAELELLYGADNVYVGE